MRSALPFLLLAAFSLPAIPASSAQTINPQSGAVCEPQPADMEMEAVRGKAETGDASKEYELGRSMLRAPSHTGTGSFLQPTP